MCPHVNAHVRVPIDRYMLGAGGIYGSIDFYDAYRVPNHNETLNRNEKKIEYTFYLSCRPAVLMCLLRYTVAYSNTKVQEVLVGVFLSCATFLLLFHPIIRDIFWKGEQ